MPFIISRTNCDITRNQELQLKYVAAQRLVHVLLLRMVGFRGVVVHDDSFLLVTDPTPDPSPTWEGSGCASSAGEGVKLRFTFSCTK